MNVIEVKEQVGASATSGRLPFTVYVNGTILRGSRGVGRRFGTSFAAALAGAKEFERLRAAQPRPAELK